MPVPLQPLDRPPRSRKLLRAAGRVALVLAALLLLGAVALIVAFKDPLRTMGSLQRVPGTKMFVVDYYGDYNLKEIREHGMDVADPIASFARVLLPEWLARLAAESTRNQIPPVREPVRRPAHSCTTVAFRTREGQVLLGRNFDWMHDACVVLRIHGRKGASSVAVLDPHYLGLDEPRLARPTLAERFRLLFLPYVAMDGLNEHGVAIGEMALSETRAPADPARPSIINPLLIRMILDYARNTDEALALIRHYNIHFPAVPCHYLIADATGRSVVVEFIEGRVETISSPEPWQVSTNHRLLGRSEAENDRACWRYQTASDRVARLDGQLDVAGMLEVMAEVSVPDWTMWTSVYNLSTGEFRVAYRRNFNDLCSGRLPILSRSRPSKPRSGPG